MNPNLFKRANGEISRDATISECGHYRYRLSRWWDDEKPSALFWMLNPSTADAAVDDNTIRRCISFAKREDCGGLIVVNWFGWRATDPQDLADTQSPIGSCNDGWIRSSIALCSGPIIAAWGSHKLAVSRYPKLASLLGGRQLLCLGTTRDGHPRHPLYVRGDAKLIDFSVSEAEVPNA